MSYDQTRRKRYILETLHKDGYVGVVDLARSFDVSGMTVRRDLTELENDGLLVRTHGGAVKSSTVDHIFSFDSRVNRNSERKEELCRAASCFVCDHDTIFVDCGTTLYRLSRYLKARRGVRVITNSLPMMSELSGNEELTVTVTGGDLVRDRRALYGRIAESMIATVHADKAFIGADGVSIAGGLSSYDEQEGAISRSMAKKSDTVYLLCDSSKIEHDSYYTYGKLSLLDYLITDMEFSREIIRTYRREGIEIIHSSKIRT